MSVRRSVVPKPIEGAESRIRGGALLLVGGTLLLLAGCGGTPPSVESSAPTEAAASPSPPSLPARDQLVPAGVVAATEWTEMGSHPSEFDPNAGHATPQALADAFGEALHAGYAGSPMRPDLNLQALDESSDRALLLISETGVGDDSVAGSQYALMLVQEEDGWRLDELWTRALCRRGGDAQFCT